ncbi:MAG: hypothetical protein B6D55_07885 [Candidatus Omnitrophica bacterium 4484_70.2]|nr:MAG: hypothetical protein B6D55_07885 [Candidatus Omnitrophica bacterium 4484_70.2]
MMRGAIGIIIVLSVLVGIFSGCKKEKEVTAKMDKEVEEVARSMETQMQLANPEYIKNATPEQMEKLSENLK